MERKEIRIRGTVQGVGFRPTVWRLARSNDLVGEVFNDAEGVLIRVSGEQGNIVRFLDSLPREVPPLAKIDAMEIAAVESQWHYQDFQIAHSNAGAVRTQVSMDAATCGECLGEVLDQTDRRHLYPFSNCTHCGPRLSIIQGIPYDRGQTTMADFPMCDQCRGEYEDPSDRRFHAQPIACHLCGPRIFVEEFDDGVEVGAKNAEETINGDASFAVPQYQNLSEAIDYNRACLDRIRGALAAGKIIAVRGLGGFHLCCDATNDEAVHRLRQRKHRYAKPFALMAENVERVSGYCEVSEIESRQLRTSSAPIVLLRQKCSQTQKQNQNDKVSGLEPRPQTLSKHVAPGSKLLGFMLPYTPLHHLIVRACPSPLVMTSGNLSDEPQVIDNLEARRKLSGIADMIVYHNRDIANRIDDSVVRCMGARPRLMRRARGFAPASIKLPAGFENSPELLAYGAELKSTFCLLKDGEAIVSQHQGDLEDVATFEDYEKNLALYRQLYQHRPLYLVADKHPEYLSSKLAQETFDAQCEPSAPGNREAPLALIRVQHHHAHIASCLAENGVPAHTPPVLGIALDGLGFGEDGTIWGGEFLLADYCGFRRLGRFKPVPMIGGVQAILEPWRNTYAQILGSLGWEFFKHSFAATDLSGFLRTKPLATLDRMLDRGINVPLTSSCGRLFDAVAAAIGLCRDRALFEGQGAIELEMHVDNDRMAGAMDDAYPFDISTDPVAGGVDSDPPEVLLTLNPGTMWMPLFEDIANGASPSVMATRFHAGLIRGVVAMVEAISKEHRFEAVALSGGCMQNKVLLENLQAALSASGLVCHTQGQVPSNDGGISLGQAAVAAARTMGRWAGGSKQKVNKRETGEQAELSV